MDAAQVETLIQGANVLACLAIATFFLRSYSRTRDRFFLLFALAFGVFAINRFALALTEESDEKLGLYLLRLVAFMLIALAIVLKNREGAGPVRIEPERGDRPV